MGEIAPGSILREEYEKFKKAFDTPRELVVMPEGWKHETDIMAEMFRHSGLRPYRDEQPELVSRCESPIERVMAYAILGLSSKFPGRLLPFGFTNEEEGYFRLGRGQSKVIVGSQVGIGSSRVDFAVLAQVMRWREPLRLVIECDGHEFHEKTKEQIAADKARERRLVAMGYYVLRFSGAEIWNDPWGCASDLVETLNHHAHAPLRMKVES